MEANRIKVSELLRAGHGKSDIAALTASSLHLRLQHQTSSQTQDASLLTPCRFQKCLYKCCNKVVLLAEDRIDRKPLLIGKNEDSISIVFHIIQKAGAPL